MVDAISITEQTAIQLIHTFSIGQLYYNPLFFTMMQSKMPQTKFEAFCSTYMKKVAKLLACKQAPKWGMIACIRKLLSVLQYKSIFIAIS